MARHFALRDAIAIGHSMGGHSLVSATILQPEIFAALVLVDPVIFPPEYYRAPPPDASYIARRRNRWASPQEMYQRFSARPPFAAWRPEALRSYCDFALLPDGGSFVPRTTCMRGFRASRCRLPFCALVPHRKPRRLT